MGELFDNICRTLATPMPRSRALKLIFGGVAGAVLAPFTFGRAPACPSNQTTCGSVCCPQSQQCCTAAAPTGGANNVCCPVSYVCCGNRCCKDTCNSGHCCGAGASPSAP